MCVFIAGSVTELVFGLDSVYRTGVKDTYLVYSSKEKQHLLYLESNASRQCLFVLSLKPVIG